MAMAVRFETAGEWWDALPPYTRKDLATQLHFPRKAQMAYADLMDHERAKVDRRFARYREMFKKTTYREGAWGHAAK